MLKLLGLFILIPVIDLLILVKIGSRLGFWPTIALIVIPGVLGAAMARSQGLAVLSDIKSHLSAGRLPGSSFIDGILIFIGGLLLISPGIITDILGFSVLFPGLRRYYRAVISRGILSRLAARSFRIHMR